MDAAGVATAVVSTSDPGVHFGDYDQARALARDCNECQARMVSDHKGRFGMFTTLPLPDIDNTLAEIAYGLDTLKAQGVGVMTSYGARYLGDPAFVPVMEELNRRKAAVFVHPLQPACCSNVVQGVPDVVVEYGTETSRTIASLLMNHTTIKCPDIRFIFSHGGGAVLFLTLPVPAHGRRRRGADERQSRWRDRADPETLFRHRAGLERVQPAFARQADAARAHRVRLGLSRRLAARHRQGPARVLPDDALTKIERGNPRSILARMG